MILPSDGYVAKFVPQSIMTSLGLVLDPNFPKDGLPFQTCHFKKDLVIQVSCPTILTPYLCYITQV